MPNLDSVQFDLGDSSLREETEEHRMWSNSVDVYHLVRVTPRPISWTFDLLDPAAAHDFYARQCVENGGVMLDMKVVQLGQHAALQGLFKYRLPAPGSLAMMFVYIVWIPFQDWAIQINVESAELGTTGMREAAVMMLEGDNWPKPDAEPIEVADVEDMFARMAARPLLVLLSDAEKYDKTFPDHPLSKVRAHMARLESTLVITAAPRELAPFRQLSRWKRLLMKLVPSA